MTLAPTESIKQADVQSRMMEWTEPRGSRKRACSRSELCLSSNLPFFCSSSTWFWGRTSWVTPCSSYWGRAKKRILCSKNQQDVPPFCISLLPRINKLMYIFTGFLRVGDIRPICPSHTDLKTDSPWHRSSSASHCCRSPSPAASLGLCGRPVSAQGLLLSVNTSPAAAGMSVLCAISFLLAPLKCVLRLQYCPKNRHFEL